jgi:hypothetical protein
MPARQRSDSKITTKIPQPAPAVRGPGRRTPAGSRRQGRTVIETPRGSRCTRPSVRGERWRAVWYERVQCQAASEDRLAARLEKVTIRLAADAPNMLRTGTV